MSKHPQVLEFLNLLKDLLQKGNFTKLSLSKVLKAKNDLNNIYIVPVEVKSEQKLSFTYRYKTKDQVKNYSIEEALDLLKELLGESFLQALLIRYRFRTSITDK